jgi:hypothetical protein
MRLMHMILVLALAAFAVPASADPWQRTGERLSLPASGLSFPLRAGTLAMTETTEASRTGEGVDAIAQYKSPDREVFATLFVYMPSYADAALAAYELDKVIRGNYGTRTEPASSAVVAAAGVPQGAIRRVYVNANDGQLATAGAVLKAGRWMAVLRVSGPMSRRAEVEAGLDALLAGLGAGTAPVEPVAELQVSDCLSPLRKNAKKVELRIEGVGLSNDPMTRSLIDAMLSQAIPNDKDKDKPPLPVSIADNGRKPVCVRDRLTMPDGGVVDLMQPAADTGAPAAIVGVVNDAGRTIEMIRSGRSKSYELRLHDVASTDNYGTFDGPLSSAQVLAVLTHDRKAPTRLSQTAYKADGTFGTTVFVAAGR